MLHENLKNYRTQKGLSQEQVALQVHVTRQTVSKWEKALSVPDAETLIKLSETLDVSVSELIGETVEEKNVSIGEVAEQLARLNEMFAISIQKKELAKKKLLHVIYVTLAVLLVCGIFSSWNDMWYEFGTNLYHWIHG